MGCLICGEDVKDQLDCKSCGCKAHFSCSYGAPVNNPRIATYFKNGDFRCPVCIISRNNGLVIKALTLNQDHIKAGTNTNVIVPDTGVVGDDDELADVEEAVAEELEAPPPRVEDAVANTVPPNSSAAVASDTSSHTNDTHIPGVAPLHQADIKRSKRLSLILNTVKQVPDHVTTLILGDSNTHKVTGKNVDPQGNKVCVRSVGGLCIYAAVYALAKYDRVYTNIRRVSWSLGANDSIHGRDQHCVDDYPSHIKALYKETKRVFPRAQVSFIMPFTGIKSVTTDFRTNLQKLLKSHAPEIKILNPPNMSGMMLRDGLHINKEGKEAYINFLVKTFARQKRPASAKAPADQVKAPPSDQSRYASEGFRLSHPHIPSFVAPPHVQYFGHGAAPFGYQGSQQPYSIQHPGLAEALSHTAQRWWSSQLQRQPIAGPTQSWPS